MNAPAQIYRVGDFEIGLIKVIVPFSEAQAQVPKGWDMASSNQAALAYKMSDGYRQELIDAPCGAWTGDKGAIKRSGERSIDDKGNRIALKPGQNWSDLVPKDRAHEYEGPGPVVVGAGYWYRLDVVADYDARSGAWVAVARRVAPEVPKGIVLRGLSSDQIAAINADIDSAQEAIDAARAKLQALEIKGYSFP